MKGFSRPIWGLRTSPSGVSRLRRCCLVKNLTTGKYVVCVCVCPSPARSWLGPQHCTTAGVHKRKRAGATVNVLKPCRPVQSRDFRIFPIPLGASLGIWRGLYSCLRVFAKFSNIAAFPLSVFAKSWTLLQALVKGLFGVYIHSLFKLKPDVVCCHCSPHLPELEVAAPSTSP